MKFSDADYMEIAVVQPILYVIRT